MKCDTHCGRDATQVRAVPTIGESLRFCDVCVAVEKDKYGKDFGWEPLTAELEAQEVAADEATQKSIEAMRFGSSG